METITIPSPSAFLSSPVPTTAKLPESPPRRKSTATTTSKQNFGSTAKKANGVPKPKQSKSRNGCITCKAKRLKCDETKPSCQQCHKRNVTCGGYKKDFKWRPFEEATFTNKVGPAKPKRNSITQIKPPDPEPTESPNHSDGSPHEPPPDLESDPTMHDTFFNAAIPSTPPVPLHDHPFPDHPFQSPLMFDMSTPPFMREQSISRSFEPDSVTRSLDSLFEDGQMGPMMTTPPMSGQSPRLIDLLLPGSELNARSDHQQPIPPQLTGEPFVFHSDLINEATLEEDIEEIIRQPPMPINNDMWMSISSALQVAPFSRPKSKSPRSDDHLTKLYRQPEVPAGSPEMLMLRFDRQTCGILSVKDGPTENPWRTLVWPLARDSPALYHAIASMTAFHTSREKPTLRVDGMEHFRRSIRSLATGIDKMRTDTALATTLVLAFSESWDQHISTGIEHIRGARILVKQALNSHNRRPLSGDDLTRLKFLCNTWVYMDVIARLTAVDEDDSTDFEGVLAPLYGPFSMLTSHTTEIDPLMGCASTLFPLIGRAANLCRKVRNSETNSIAIISQAIELKEQIERWDAGTVFERPEDPSAEIQHALQTAEAYRYATLLYLHQAVPEIPSLTSAQLAKKVLVYLATVPLSSRLVIVQIFPLLAAGSEAQDAEDRKWVDDRWNAMINRMWIGNIEKCWFVTQEVWTRRDRLREAAETAMLKERRIDKELSKRKLEEETEDMYSFPELQRGNSISSSKRRRSTAQPPQPHQAVPAQPKKRSNEPITEELDNELTVRGSAHWAGVMKDLEWEVLLG